MSEPDSRGGRTATLDDPTPSADGAALWQKVRRYFQAREQLRSGLCLLNAGCFEKAAAKFGAIADAELTNVPLATYLAMCYVGRSRHTEAADQFKQAAKDNPDATTAQIRQALSLWQAGCRSQAVLTLRGAISQDSENAELHFQLATMLAAQGETQEAELRFTQVTILDDLHGGALAALAMCCGARGAPQEAVRYLRRAQRVNPADASVALLLAMAAQAADEQGGVVGVRVEMPDFDQTDAGRVDELGHLIAAEPEFLEAFLSIPDIECEDEVFGLLGRAIEVALKRQPSDAVLHYGHARLLERLGRSADAIEAIEQAVEIDSRFVNALVHLGKLYQKTDRRVAARERLEQAIALGADYADVYFMLGNLYRDGGETARARQAYQSALRINGDYRDAQQALGSLAA